MEDFVNGSNSSFARIYNTYLGGLSQISYNDYSTFAN